VKIFRYDTDGQIMFIVRYPSQLCRSMGWDLAGGWKNFIFSPARYDTGIFGSAKGGTATTATNAKAAVDSDCSDGSCGIAVK
jgi:hypothetical protein